MWDNKFNDCVLGFSLAHAAKVGFLDAIQKCSHVNLKTFSEEQNAPVQVLKELCDNLSMDSIVIVDDNLDVTKGINFSSGYENSGYFEWLMLGYGSMLSSAHSVQGNPDVNKIDGSSIASGSSRIGVRDIDPVLFPFIKNLVSSSYIDLGCGAGTRLIEVGKNDPVLNCVGFDINAAAVNLAKENVDRAGMADRTQVYQQDVSDISEHNLNGVCPDVVSMCFMGHDMWPEEQAKNTFQKLRKVFAQCNHFILADTIKEDIASPSIFTQGFRLTHAMMNKYFPTRDEWEKLLTECGWQLIEVIPLDVQSNYIFHLKPTK